MLRHNLPSAHAKIQVLAGDNKAKVEYITPLLQLGQATAKAPMYLSLVHDR